MTDANACTTTNCVFIEMPLERCEREHCPFAWQRRAREDRARREEKDRRFREEGAAG